MSIVKPLNRKLHQYFDELDKFKNCLGKFPQALFNKAQSYNLSDNRKIEFKPPPGSEIILTTYFVTKRDPQRGLFVNSGDFEYIRNWYNSVISLNLKAIVFVDFMDEEFNATYENDNILFVNCSLGSYSLNDERFFIYLTYISFYHNRITKVFLTDINDVSFQLSPFKLIDSYDDYVLFIGRNHTNTIFYSNLIMEKLKYLTSSFNLRFSANFYLQPAYNAGIIGARTSVVLLFLNHMCHYLNRYAIDKNLNMLLTNLVLYVHFCPRTSVGFFYNVIVSRFGLSGVKIMERIKRILLKKTWAQMKKVNHYKDRIGNSCTIISSYPLHNAFKSYHSSGNEYILHK
jgi:hypothetical protein